jgi:hypothetical protein
MELLGFILLAVGSILAVSGIYWKQSRCAFDQFFRTCKVLQWNNRRGRGRTAADNIQEIRNLIDCHETANVLNELIHKDGAGSWPPRANHTHSNWPAALQPYKEIYEELGPLLPTDTPSLDDQVNSARIAQFRAKFRNRLRERVDLGSVRQLLRAAESGRWDVFPRDIYNAFYCCIASCRHAYR